MAMFSKELIEMDRNAEIEALKKELAELKK